MESNMSRIIVTVAALVRLVVFGRIAAVVLGLLCGTMMLWME